MEFFVVLLALMAGHYIADFAMQNEFVATMKGRVHSDPHGIHALVALSFHHGSATALALWATSPLTEIPVELGLVLSLVVLLSHGVLDYFKANRGSFSIHEDQYWHFMILLGTTFSAASYA